METLKIIFFSVLLAILYGIVHDMLTAHVCVEYFSIAHPKVIESNSPVMLALAWGVLATWWVGLFLGIVLAMGARGGKRTAASANVVLKQMVYFLAVLFVLALVAGLVGYFLSKTETIYMTGRLSKVILPDKHDNFIFDMWMHNASYLFGCIGGVLLAIRIYMKRKEIG